MIRLRCGRWARRAALIWGVVVNCAAGGMAGSAAAATITSLTKFTNDGVYSITADTADLLGVAGATHLGFLRIHDGATGDSFNARAILGATPHGHKLAGVLNGLNDGLDYAGIALDQLGSTTLLNDSRNFYQGVVLAFDGTRGAVVVKGSRGTATFNAKQARGAAEGYFQAAIDAQRSRATKTNPVPLPAMLPALIGALTGLGLVARRRRSAHEPAALRP